MKEAFSCPKVTDEQIKEVTEEVEGEYGYLLDPHSAIAYLALKQDESGLPGVFFETAHPAKFPDTVPHEIETPIELKKMGTKKKQTTSIRADYQALLNHCK